MNSEQQTVELTSFQFPEPDPEVLDEIIEVSKFIILLSSLLANFYLFNIRVPYQLMERMQTPNLKIL